LVAEAMTLSLELLRAALCCRRLERACFKEFSRVNENALNTYNKSGTNFLQFLQKIKIFHKKIASPQQLQS